MTRLPEPPARQPHATQAGQSTPHAAAHAFLADIEDAMAPAVPTFYRNDTLPSTPTIGPTPPVAQPGRPPMSQRAVDINTTILTSSVLTATLGGAATGILWASGHADPTVVGCIVAAPAALALPILALSRLVKRAKEAVHAAPPVVHHHYNGTVIHDERTLHSKNNAVWVSNRNQLPPSRTGE